MVIAGSIIGFILIFMTSLVKNLVQYKRKENIEIKLKDIQNKLK